MNPTMYWGALRKLCLNSDIIDLCKTFKIICHKEMYPKKCICSVEALIVCSVNASSINTRTHKRSVS